MPANEIAETSRMLKALKKEEQHLKRSLRVMDQCCVKLQIEELNLRAAIRQEQNRLNEFEVKKNGASQYSSLSRELKGLKGASISDIDQQSTLSNSASLQATEMSQSSSDFRSLEAETVSTNITDDRYLDSLILNPVTYGNEDLIEFDD